MPAAKISHLIVAAGVLLYGAACQAPEQKEAPSGAVAALTAERVAALPPDQSRPAVERLSNEVIAAQTANCNEMKGDAWQGCINAQLLRSFDRYGFLAQHCTKAASNAAFRDCVMAGRAGVDWLLAIGGSPDTDFDWTAPAKAQQAAITKLNDELTRRCEGKPEDPGNSCFTQQSAKLLGLSENVAASCAQRADLKLRGACIIDAHDAAMYQGALIQLAE